MSVHPFDWQGLAWGGLALAVVGHWLARELGLVDTGDLALLLPLVLIVAGLVGVTVSVLRPRRPRTTPDPSPTTTPEEHR
ncbi:MAG: hypothetical protein Q7T56_03915 [Nocardioidaceae bacterium]|nr:hypothetical protein [Nocardioidaceae bacterium]